MPGREDKPPTGAKSLFQVALPASSCPGLVTPFDMASQFLGIEIDGTEVAACIAPCLIGEVRRGGVAAFFPRPNSPLARWTAVSTASPPDQNVVDK